MQELYEHQKKIINQLPEKHLLCWGTGAAKSRTSIEMANKVNQPTLFICPKGLKENWAREISKWSLKVEYLILSKEEFKKYHKTLEKFNVVVVDECHYFLGTKSQLMKSLMWYFKKHNVQYRWMLSATPYRSTPMDIYILAKLLGFYVSYNDFQNKFFDFIRFGNGSRLVPIPKKNIEKDIASFVRKMGSVIKLEDCFDVPEQVYLTEYFELTKEQIKGIQNIDDILPIVKYTKEHQICGGTLKGDEYNDEKFFKSNKSDRLLEVLKDNKKAIVVCRYNNEIEYLKDIILADKKIKDKKVRIISGNVSNRDEILQELKDHDNYVLIVNAKISEGWELPQCPLVIFYSYDWSLTHFIQMKGRVQRSNNIKKNVYLSLITKDSVDEAVYQSIMNKEDFHVEIYAKES